MKAEQFTVRLAAAEDDPAISALVPIQIMRRRLIG